MKFQSIYATRFMPAKIISCSNDDYWYKNNVGDKIKIREVKWASPFVEADNGFSILKIDLQYKNNPKTKKQ